MKKIIFAAVLTLVSTPALTQSQTHVRGHLRSDGTYVPPHYRTTQNSTRNDNWTTRPNVNPYTGRVGTRAPDYSSPSYRPYSRRR